MKVIEITQKEYPKSLLKIYDPPKKLYVMGDESILNNFGIAIVGSRNATDYGRKITKSISYGLAKKGINIISGMAKPKKELKMALKVAKILPRLSGKRVPRKVPSAIASTI